MDAIDSWLELGDILVLGIDMNEDVRTGQLAYKLKEKGLMDAVLSQHQDLSPQATYQWNQSCTPVDAIWCTRGIEIERVG